MAANTFDPGGGSQPLRIPRRAFMIAGSEKLGVPWEDLTIPNWDAFGDETDEVEEDVKYM